MSNKMNLSIILSICLCSACERPGRAFSGSGAGQHAAEPQQATLFAVDDSLCVGLSAEDRDLGPFRRREDIHSVSGLRREDQPDDFVTVLTGAEVVFRAVPGLTAEYLQRLVDCNLARNAELDPSSEDSLGLSPLLVPGVSALVHPVHAGFAVDIESEDRALAREILTRAQRWMEQGL